MLCYVLVLRVKINVYSSTALLRARVHDMTNYHQVPLPLQTPVHAY